MPTALVIAALALAGCERSAPSPQGPLDVRVTELSPEVLDQLADRVADRVAERAPAAAPAAAPATAPSRVVITPPDVPAVPGARREPRANAEVEAPPTDRDAATRRRGPRVAQDAPPPPPPPTDALEAAALADVEAAVDRALEWLSRHQEPGGEWNPAAGGDAASGESASGVRVYAPGVTGLAVRCYLANGDTHRSGAHRKTVQSALRYLKTIQDSEGCFGPRTSPHFQYNHASAALAMVEAWGATRSELFARSAQRGVDFVQMSQNPYLGWRYGVRDGDNDTSVTGWMVHVLRAAESADLQVDRGAYQGAVTWVDKMTEPEFGRVGYQRRGGPPARTQEMMEQFPAELSESLTAVGVTIRVSAGQDVGTNEFIRKGARLLVNKPPRWTDVGSVDFYYWYWGTIALADVGGDHWNAWSRSLVRALTGAQDEDGSWDPVGPWAREGGRAYSTALACLALQELLAAERGR